MDVKNHSYFFERDDNLTAIKSRNLPAGAQSFLYPVARLFHYRDGLLNDNALYLTVYF